MLQSSSRLLLRYSSIYFLSGVGCTTPVLVDAPLDVAEGDVPGLDAPRIDAPLADGSSPDAPPPPLDAPMLDGIMPVDAPVPDAGRVVPMFVAIGQKGRITTSCDDGRTWVFNRSDDDTADCGAINCFLHPGMATGLAYGGGHFFAMFGVGAGSRLFRSRNGVDWTLVMTERDGRWYNGLAFSNGALIGSHTPPVYARDPFAAAVTSKKSRIPRTTCLRVSTRALAASRPRPAGRVASRRSSVTPPGATRSSVTTTGARTAVR